MRYFFLFVLAAAASVLFFPGCLTVESKEYRIKMKTDQTGEATIRFVNILSEADDSLDISKDDFRQLMDFYIEGSQIEMDNPGYRNVKKRLYEQNGVLMGEITFSFDSLSSLRIFKFDDDSPYMYFVGNPLSSEQLVETNGVTGPEWMPAVFWNQGSKDLYVKTKITSEVSHHRSLLRNFQEWQANHQNLKKQ